MSVTPRGWDEALHALSELESDAFLEEMSAQLGEKIDELIQQGFHSATAPDGSIWAPRKLAAGARRAPHLPLDYSGAMKSGFHIGTNREGVKVVNEVVGQDGYAYAEVQNYGNRAGTLAARPMVPVGDDLGRWEAPLRETAQRVFNSKLNEVG